MSILNDAKLTLIPSGYKSTKVYSVKPTNGDGDFTFARTGEATRINPGGNIETVATNVPRIDHFGGGCPSLLLEDASTNRQVNSEKLDNADWQKQADLTVVANQIISPSGELTADKIQRGSTINTNNYIGDAVNKSSAAQLDIAISVFVKQGEGDFFAMRAQGGYSTGRVDFIYQFSTNTITANAPGTDATLLSTKSESYGNGWIRLSFVFNSDANAANSTFFSPRATSGNIDSSDTSSTAFVYVWGCQVEENSFSTSYIPTTTTLATRNAETCDASGNSNIFNDSEGVLYAEISALADDGTVRAICISNGTAGDAITIRYSVLLNLIRVEIKDGNVQQFFFQTTSYNFLQFVKLAVKYKANDCKVYINGVQVATDTSVTIPSGLNTLNFDSGSGNQNF